MSTKSVGKATSTFSTNSGIKQGLSILALEEWFKLQGFCDMAVNTNPCTENDMRKALGVPDGTALKIDFTDTVALYSDLKGYCTVFNDEIRPGTIELASDIVQYNRRVGVIYGRLITAISEYGATGDSTTLTLTNLAKQWGTGAPSTAADSVKTQFQKYVGMLHKDAEARKTNAANLKTKLTDFVKNLKKSNGAFKLNVTDYTAKYASASKELEETKASIVELESKLRAMRKKHADEEIVLETAPLYLIIPFVGPFIMAGVLVGVGIDYGLDVENLKGEIAKLVEIEKKRATDQTFFDNYQAALRLTAKTVADIESVLPLVGKLELAWNALASDLADLVTQMTSARSNSLAEDWDFTSLDLETAQTTWADLAAQADQYRRFGVAEKAVDVDHLALGMVAGKIAA